MPVLWASEVAPGSHEMTQPTPEQKRLIIQAQLAKRELARRSLLQFTQQTLQGYTPGWVHKDITARLEKFSRDVIAKKSPRLMLLMPPRHGKSELASIRFPAWHLGHAPNHEIINVGYNMDLPMIFSRKVRDTLKTPVYQGIFPNTRLDPNTQSVEAWMTTGGGGFTAAGVGGGITGKGAHVLIIDDPLKNQEEADSADRRDLLEAWYETTAYTRLAPGGGVLFIETWWNDDDLAGRLQNKMRTIEGADQYELIKYPAIAEGWEYKVYPSMEIIRTDEASTDEEVSLLTQGTETVTHVELLRPKGEGLHLERYPTDALLRIKANTDRRVWSALYQQNPVPDEGMFFNRDQFRVIPVAPDPRFMRIYTAWDFAIGEKQVNDWTVGTTIAQDHNDVLFVLEVNRFKGDSFRIVEEILDTAAKWSGVLGADYQIGVEDGQLWRAFSPLVTKRMAERLQYPSIEVMKPLTDKTARARPLQGRMQQGRLLWPSEAAWYEQARSEMLRFPAGVHDDVVDSLAWAVRMVIGKQPPAHETDRMKQVQKSWRDRLNGFDVHAGGWMSS